MILNENLTKNLLMVYTLASRFYVTRSRGIIELEARFPYEQIGGMSFEFDPEDDFEENLHRFRDEFLVYYGRTSLRRRLDRFIEEIRENVSPVERIKFHNQDFIEKLIKEDKGEDNNEKI